MYFIARLAGIETQMPKWMLIGLLLLPGCQSPPASSVETPTAPKEPSLTSSTPSKPTSPPAPLAQIDLTKIGRVAPKGRLQDTEYNHLPVVENLIAHGNEAPPFLIDKLDDETKIDDHVFDYWREARVGDVAFVILADLFTDSNGRTTIPGVDYDTFLGRAPNSGATEELLRNYIATRGRHDITKRWRNTWAQYKNRVYWDDADRCFRLRQA